MNNIEAAIQGAGGPSAVARAVGVTVQAVCFWRDGKRTLPDDVCPDLERMNGGRIVVEELRPDVTWHRIADAEWPHPEGRPLIDAASTKGGA